MKRTLQIIIMLAFVAGINSNAKTVKVNNLQQYNSQVATLSAGDSIVLANGVWKDARLVFKGRGVKGSYIYLTAETPGKVTLEGTSSLQLSGQWLYVSGLMFVNGYSLTGDVIEFKTKAGEYAFNSVVDNCVIDSYNQPDKNKEDHWISLWGQNNTVQYTYMGGKSNLGTTMVVWPNDSACIHNHHHIYRNYFGSRPRLGANGGETIRLGTSQVCHLSSETVVEGNYFEHCNGEVEIISNKSCDNLFINNTFFESEGSLVLRHGHRATVAGNWFIGNEKPFTGGVRIINEGHKVYNNFFYKLRGDDFRSSLTIMNGIPDSPANGYVQVKNVTVANNTYYDCAVPWNFCVGAGERNRIMKPESTTIVNNLVYCPQTVDLIQGCTDNPGIKLDNNMLTGKTTGNQNGLSFGRINGIEVVVSSMQAKPVAFVQKDILNCPRQESVVGALQSLNETSAVEFATAANCGPKWYKVPAATRHASSGKQVAVTPGTDKLQSAVSKAQAGDMIVLQPGEYTLTKKTVIDKDLVIKAGDPSVTTLLWKGERASVPVFEVTGQSDLKLEGLTIDANAKSAFPAKYAVATSKGDASGYSLRIDRCIITGFNTKAGAVVKAYKSTFADSIILTNSVFRKSAMVLSLAEEKDDTGKYNAETVKLDNCVLDQISQCAINYYRGGNDESTLGGNLQIDHCVFSAVADSAGLSVLKLTGIVAVKITNSIFASTMGKTTVKLSGDKHLLRNCCFYNSPRPLVEKQVQSSGIVYSNPKFGTDFSLDKKSSLIGKGTDGFNIGLR
jgi:poly(beta-D-mannuronate) lyase